MKSAIWSLGGAGAVWLKQPSQCRFTQIPGKGELQVYTETD